MERYAIITVGKEYHVGDRETGRTHIFDRNCVYKHSICNGTEYLAGYTEYIEALDALGKQRLVELERRFNS